MENREDTVLRCGKALGFEEEGKQYNHRHQQEVESQWRARLDKICRNLRVSATFLGVPVLQRAGKVRSRTRISKTHTQASRRPPLLEQQRAKMGAAAES